MHSGWLVRALLVSACTSAASQHALWTSSSAYLLTLVVLPRRSWDADLITPEEEMEMDAFVERLDFEDYFSHWVSLATSVSAADLLATAEMSR